MSPSCKNFLSWPLDPKGTVFAPRQDNSSIEPKDPGSWEKFLVEWNQRKKTAEEKWRRGYVTGPEIVPEARRSPGLMLQPVTCSQTLKEMNFPPSLLPCGAPAAASSSSTWVGVRLETHCRFESCESYMYLKFDFDTVPPCPSLGWISTSNSMLNVNGSACCKYGNGAGSCS